MQVEITVGADPNVDNSRRFYRPAFANVYAIAGRFVCVEANNRDAADLFTHYFSGWHLSALSRASHVKPHATIVVRDGAPPRPPTHLQPFAVADDGICRTDETTYFFENSSSVVRAGNRDMSRIEVWIGDNKSTSDRKTLARLIFNAAMTAMRRCGLYELHAAGVIAPDGEGVLIVGPSGSGKSTLATHLATAGWQYLSDDSVLLYEEGKQVYARALRRVFALTSTSLAAASALNLSDTMTQPFDPDKRRFEPEVVFPNRFAEKCIPARVFFPKVTNEPSTSSRQLSRAATMAQLLRMCPWAAYDKAVAEPHVRVLETLARQAVGFELAAGRDLLADASFTADYFRNCAN